MPSTRLERIQEQLVQEISDILRREVRDPRIGFVTITGAKVSPDLRHARIFVSVLGTPEEQEAALAGLASASRFIRAAVARRVDLRVVPELRFVRDVSVERGIRIHELLEEAKREQPPPVTEPEHESGDDPGGGRGPASGA